MSSLPEYHLWFIQGTLVVRSPLHVGNGDVGSLEVTGRATAREQQHVEVQRVASDSNDRPCVPGSAIKGALRSWFEASNHQEQKYLEAFARLFGDAKSETGDSGNAEFGCARLVPLNGTPAGSSLPFWTESRQTAVSVSVGIDRFRRVASPEKLFYTEYVTPGAEFRLTIEGRSTSDDVETDLSLMSGLLESFDGQLRGCSIGASNSDGWGIVQWAPTETRVMSADDIKTWLSDGHAGPPSKFEPHTPTPVIFPGPRSRIGYVDIEVSMNITGPFLVKSHAPSRAIASEEHEVTKPLIDTQGRPYLPAKSMRGVLRSRAERILRSMNVNVCDVHRSECTPIHDEADMTGLCPVCQIFGAPGWGTRIWISDFVSEGEPVSKKQDFVAIDEFTGGTAAGKKFIAEYFRGVRLKGELSFEMDDIPTWAIGLIGLVFRDWHDGELTFGHGYAKGFGAGRLTKIRHLRSRVENGVSGWDPGKLLPQRDEPADLALTDEARQFLNRCVDEFHGICNEWIRQEKQVNVR